MFPLRTPLPFWIWNHIIFCKVSISIIYASNIWNKLNIYQQEIVSIIYALFFFYSKNLCQKNHKMKTKWRPWTTWPLTDSTQQSSAQPILCMIRFCLSSIVSLRFTLVQILKSDSVHIFKLLGRQMTQA